ncbi:MAG: ABC transporter permease, partial [Bryobacterales bacterium]|nr:ABC transporter permease [Bryobacterales bacterium]
MPVAEDRSMLHDMRYGFRSLRKSPGFTMTAVAVLALAIGAGTALFSVVYTVLLRPLPYRSADRLAMLWTEDPARSLREGRSALWDIDRWRGESQSFEGLASFDAMSSFLTTADGVEQIAGAGISPNLLPLLGVSPVLGRNFSSEDARQGRRLVLISHGFWQSRWGGQPGVLGAVLVLNGLPHQVIGVLPEGFQVARLAADVWKPHDVRQETRGREAWFVVGRLRPEVTMAQAQAEMTAVAGRLRDQLPADARSRTVRVVPLREYMVGPDLRLGLWMLGGAVLCVFLIAAANVTSLALARSAAREKEMALRGALGASAGRLVRQRLTEGVLLAGASGVAGVLLASACLDLIRAYGPAGLPRLDETRLGPESLAWALGISMLAGVLVGLPPA